MRLAISMMLIFYGCLAFYLAACFLLDLLDPTLQTLAGRPRLAGAIIALLTVSLIGLALAAVRIWPLAKHLIGSAMSHLEGNGEEDFHRPEAQDRSRRANARD